MSAFFGFINNIVRHRHMIGLMALREFASRYAGTLGGAVWAVVHPVALVMVFWFVFSVGFKAQGPGGIPFVLYFISGFIPWLMFSEVLNASANGVTSHAYLVKKLVFPTEVLPLIYLTAAGITHAVFLFVTLIVLSAHGIALFPYFFQVIYYFLALCLFLLGAGWIVSALNVFHRDVGQALTVVLNLWFWLTPIVWTVEMIPAEYRWMLQLNPLVYVVEGYRNSLIYQKPIWADLTGSVYYWVGVGLIFVGGAQIFRRLKLEFADAL